MAPPMWVSASSLCRTENEREFIDRSRVIHDAVVAWDSCEQPEQHVTHELLEQPIDRHETHYRLDTIPETQTKPGVLTRRYKRRAD